MRELGRLDSTTARLVAAGVDLEQLGEKAGASDPATPVVDVMSGRPKQAEAPLAEGIVTAADVARLDPLTADVGGAGLGDLSQHIDNARARTGPSAAYRRRGVDQVVVPRADIEIDVDMESVNEGCYLWGTLLNERDASGDVGRSTCPSSRGIRTRGGVRSKRSGLLGVAHRPTAGAQGEEKSLLSYC